jgi:hypothetical protein
MNRESYIRFGELLYNKKILPKDLKIASRKVTYWKDNDILPYFENQKHGRMNIPQAIWLLIIQELSNLGISSKRLAKLSYDVWKKPKDEKYADKVIQDIIKSKKSNLDDYSKNILKNQLTDELLMDTLRGELNPFTDMIKSCVLTGQQPHSLIYKPKTGEHHFLLNNNEVLIKLNSLYSQESIVCVPILDKLSKMISFDFNSTEKELKYLTDIENQIREIVIFKQPKIVEIAFDDNHIKPRIITEKHVKEDEIADFFLNNKIPKGTKLLIDVRSQDNYKLTLITK